MYNQDLRPSQHEGTAGTDPHLAGDESRADHFTSLPTFNVSLLADRGCPAYLTFTQIGIHWHGHSSLKNLFVFGDSYSSRLSGSWETDEDDPHDIDDSDDDTTWVDFLASSVSSRSTAAVVNNFAFPGATVEYDLDGQLARFFDQFSRGIESGEATFVLFLGINDCGGIPGEDLSSLVEALFDGIHRLYIGAAARNFILIDVPPTDRSPAAAGIATDLASRIDAWNESLVTHASDFVSNNTQATMQVFSSNKVLSGILDNPGAQGFAENAKDVVGRGIWRDDLHLTPAVHEIIVSRMSSALGF